MTAEFEHPHQTRDASPYAAASTVSEMLGQPLKADHPNDAFSAQITMHAMLLPRPGLASFPSRAPSGERDITMEATSPVRLGCIGLLASSQQGVRSVLNTLPCFFAAASPCQESPCMLKAATPHSRNTSGR